MTKRYSLQIAISTLFISITLVLGVVLSWQSFNKTSQIMLDSAHELYQRISSELSLDFVAKSNSVNRGLSQFRLSPVIEARTFVERIRYLSGFQAVLESGQDVFSVGIGYQDGDYLGVGWSDATHVQEKYEVPATARYVVFYLNSTQGASDSDPAFAAGKLYAIFFDRQLNELTRSAGEDTGFDPRQRPWYQQATSTPAMTKPYLFYDSKQVGLTAMSNTSVPGAVVVFDITLQSLSQAIAKYRITATSEVVLIDSDGEVFAYDDQQKVVISSQHAVTGKGLQLATLDQLGSAVLSYVGRDIKRGEQALDFEYEDRRWIGSVRLVAEPGGVDLYAMMLSPVDELLAGAIETRQQLLFIALLVLLFFIPLVWFASKKISTPLNQLAREAGAISRFDFSETPQTSSSIKEVAALDDAMTMMKSTISRFITLINSLAGEQDLDALLKIITVETMSSSQSDAALIYLLDEKDDLLKADFLCDSEKNKYKTGSLPELTLEQAASLSAGKDENRVLILDAEKQSQLSPLLAIFETDALGIVVLSLKNRNDESIGLLCLIYKQNLKSEVEAGSIAFVEALSGFAAVTLESRQLFNMQEALLHSFIELIAGAIDAKSPYTSGHCQRVPEITLMLAEAACASQQDEYADFDLDDKQWQELRIACWLHDCGKVTTPEYVVDKATRLETIYDRIHEVRTRFEVLKRDAEIGCWQQIAGGGDRQALLAALEQKKKNLDDDFSFVAECNAGGEFMAEERIERLQKISEISWQRTIDDRLGLSWEELKRKPVSDDPLPVAEKLLSDKPEHLIARHEVDTIPEDNPWGFKLDTPQYKYNRGELYNLSVQRGTLSEEERYMINGHMIQTIIMLNKLPYPKHLKDVPLIAGSHHETMDGQGYPKRLLMSEQPLTARMMVIADIFEALTASDRPYKKAKTLSESLRILSFMRDDNHIDSDLFALFLSSGVYLEYAQKFLSADQIDDVDIEQYLSSGRSTT